MHFTAAFWKTAHISSDYGGWSPASFCFGIKKIIIIKKIGVESEKNTIFTVILGELCVLMLKSVVIFVSYFHNYKFYIIIEI